MAGLRRRLNGALSARFPEKRLFIQSSDATRYLRLTPLSQLLLGSAALAAAGWMAVATATVVLDRVLAEHGATRAVVIHEAYRARLEELAAERDQRAAEARSAQGRFQVAMEQISRQQTATLHSVEERRELATALDLMRDRLREAVAQRDTVAAANDRLLAQMDEVSATLDRDGASGDDLAAMLGALSSALSEAVVDRDTASAERAELARQLADLELRLQLNAARQDEMVEELEQAVAMSFGPLEQLFDKTDLDVDHLIATVRRTHSGQGGPLGTATISTRSFDDPELTSRFDQLMVDLDRMNLLRIAAGKIPYAMPVQDGYRFTSGFGPRRGPQRITGSISPAPRGTPIFAAADGVVTSAELRERLRQRRAHPARVRVRDGLRPPEQNPRSGWTTGIARRANW